MEKQFDVVVVGELNVDLILNQIERTPEIGKEVLAHQATLTLGSSSAIFASNLSTLGSKVCFVGKVGEDSFGDFVIASLKSRGVNVDSVIRSATSNTGITTVLNYNEDRAMVTHQGAMSELAVEDIPNELLQKSRHLHVSSVFLQTALKPNLVSLFKKAKSLGLTTSIDPQWDPSEKWSLDLETLLPYVDIFAPNAEEVRWLANEPDFDRAVNAIRAMGNVLVVKKGRDGAFLYSAEEKIFQDAFLNDQVADSIGAGDSFNAGFIHKFLQKKSYKECLEFAALMGAINTTQPGGTKAFETINNVKTIAKSAFNYHF